MASPLSERAMILFSNCAEGVGFEPTRLFRPTRFQDELDKPTPASLPIGCLMSKVNCS